MDQFLKDLQKFVSDFSKYVAGLKRPSQTAYTPPSATEPKTTTPTVPIAPQANIEPRAVLNPTAPYDWSTPKAACHSVRVICDEEGLQWHEKELIAKVINAESGFKNWAKLENKKDGKVWSTDWGVCQINDWYHIGPGKTFPSVTYVLDNPDKVVRWMIKQYKAGNLEWWVAYKSGSYKRFASKI